MPTHPSGKLVLLIGPSGVGKSVLLKKLRAKHPELHFPRSATTRVRREREGDELYHFVTDAEFDALLKDDKILEWAIVHGGARYGTMLEEIIPHIERGQTVVREVDVQGFESIRKHPLFTGSNAQYRLQSIFILPESREQLIDRIVARAPITEEELNHRIASMDTELSFAKLCTSSVKNPDGKLQETYKKIETLIMEK